MQLSAIVPARDEASLLAPTVRALLETADRHAVEWEILLVEDGSTDTTRAVAEGLAREDQRVRLVSPSPGGGFGRAVRAGFAEAGGDVLAVVMGDGSDDPADLVRYHEAIEAGHDCAFGSRFAGGARVAGYPRARRVLNRLGNHCLRALFRHGHDDTSNAFKAYRREVIDACAPLRSDGFELTVELPLKAVARGYRFASVPVSWRPRTAGRSKFRVRSIGRYLAVVADALGARRRMRLGAVVVVAALMAVSAQAWDEPGPEFDEGLVLAHAVHVAQGHVPHRDFGSFHGPGNPWLLAGAFAVGGRRQSVERAVAVAYRLALVAGVLALALAAGAMPAALAGGATVVLLAAEPLFASAAIGALGLSLLALALLASAGGRPRSALCAGLAGGGVLLLRPDFAAALALAAVPLLLRGRESWRALALGAAPGALAMAVHLGVVGPDALMRVARDWAASAPARRLPLDAAEGTGLLTVVAVLAAVSATAALLQRRPPALAAALLALSLIPYAVSRLDYTHVLVPLVPAVVAGTIVAGRRAALVPVMSVAAALALVPLDIQRGAGRPVAVGDRSFILDRARWADAEAVLDAAERERRAGAGSLFVGPADLRRTIVNGAYIYFLLAGLEPASYYTELNPGAANGPPANLAGDVARADLLILDASLDAIDEPNASRRLGPAEPNRVVADMFCPVLTTRTLTLMRRCAAYPGRP